MGSQGCLWSPLPLPLLTEVCLFTDHTECIMELARRASSSYAEMVRRAPFDFDFRVQRDDDVTIKVLFCGLCHTDLHVIKNEFGNAMYPVVPG